MIAADFDPLHHHFSGSRVPGHAILFSQFFRYILKNRIREPAVYILGIIFRNRDLIATHGAGILIIGLGQRIDQAFVSALFVLTESHTVFQVDTVLQYQFLVQGLLVFFICEPAVFVHGPKDIFFSFLVVFGILIGVVPGRRVGDADDTCAFRCSQAFDFLTVIGSSSTADTAAALTQINKVQIKLKDLLFVIALFQLDRTEDLQHFTLHSNIISTLILRQQHIFDQLLGDTGAAYRVIAKEHSGTGFDGGHPVNALVFEKAVVLNGNSRMDHIFGNILNVCPGAAGCCKDVLIFLDLTVGIHIIQVGVLFQFVSCNIHICHGQNVILQIVAQHTNKNKGADSADNQHRSGRTQRYLK